MLLRMADCDRVSGAKAVCCIAMCMQADLRDDDIEMQGVSLSNLLSKYFLPQKLGLLPTGYWKDFRGFEIKLQVSLPDEVLIVTRPCLFCIAALQGQVSSMLEQKYSEVRTVLQAGCDTDVCCMLCASCAAIRHDPHTV